MKTLLSLLGFLVASTSGLAAQSIAVRGRAVEVTSQEPLVGATVVLYAADDSLPHDSRVTGPEGAFVFESPPPGSYYVRVSFIGLVEATTESFQLSDDVDVGTVSLERSPLLLEDIEVTGERSAVVREIDRIVYDVDDDVQALAGSVSDVLQNLPSITVGVDGAISLRGTPNVTVFINGRPSALLRRNASAALEQLPGAAVARVEVITNPSARFRPDGVGGIINIVLKEDAALGLDGQVGAHAGNEARYNGNARISVGSDRLDWFASYGLRHSDAGSVFSDLRRTGQAGAPLLGRYDESGTSRVDALSHSVFSGATVQINERQSLDLSGNFFYQTSLHAGLSEILASDASAQPTLELSTDETNDEFEREGELALAYEGAFGEEESHVLAVEVARAAFREREDLAFNQTLSVPATGLEIDRLLVEKSGTQTEIALDYSVELGEDSELEAGYAGERIREDIAYANNLDQNRFLFDQDIHAWYATYQRSFDRFQIQAGLRAEVARITSRVTVPFVEATPNNYSKLFPTLHLAYAVSEPSRFGLSYSRRLNRPDADELNPNPEFSDPRNAEAGNASLLPELVDSFELSFVSTRERFTIAPTLYYRYTTDAFTQVQNLLSSGVLLTTTENLRTEKAGGLETVLSATLSDRWSVDLTGDVSYNRIDAGNLGFAEDRSVVTGTARAFVVYRPVRRVRFQLNGFYLFPWITPQGRRQSIAYLNGGVEVAFAGGRGALTLTGTDVFHSYRVKRSLDTAVLSQNVSARRTGAAFLVGVTWRFGARQGEPEMLFDDVGVGPR